VKKFMLSGLFCVPLFLTGRYLADAIGLDGFVCGWIAGILALLATAVIHER
jgi:hypothetical protein